MKSFYITFKIKGRVKSIILEARSFASAEQEFNEQVTIGNIIQISLFN